MSTLIKFIATSSSIKGASFTSIKNYENTKGEISNQTINFGETLSNSKLKDLIKMQNSNKNDLKTSISKKLKLNIDEKFSKTFDQAFEVVYNSLLIVGDTLLNGIDKKVVNNRMRAQQIGYTVINKGLKIHKENEELYIYGMVKNKTIIKKGEYKKVNSRLKTIIQNNIKKELDFNSIKFRQFIFKKSDMIKMRGFEFNGGKLMLNF